jgi:hypothetical protein
MPEGTRQNRACTAVVHHRHENLLSVRPLFRFSPPPLACWTSFRFLEIYNSYFCASNLENPPRWVFEGNPERLHTRTHTHTHTHTLGGTLWCEHRHPDSFGCDLKFPSISPHRYVFTCGESALRQACPPDADCTLATNSSADAHPGWLVDHSFSERDGQVGVYREVGQCSVEVPHSRALRGWWWWS